MLYQILLHSLHFHLYADRFFKKDDIITIYVGKTATNLNTDDSYRLDIPGNLIDVEPLYLVCALCILEPLLQINFTIILPMISMMLTTEMLMLVGMQMPG